MESLNFRQECALTGQFSNHLFWLQLLTPWKYQELWKQPHHKSSCILIPVYLRYQHIFKQGNITLGKRFFFITFLVFYTLYNACSLHHLSFHLALCNQRQPTNAFCWIFRFSCKNMKFQILVSVHFMQTIPVCFSSSILWDFLSLKMIWNLNVLGYYMWF